MQRELEMIYYTILIVYQTVIGIVKTDLIIKARQIKMYFIDHIATSL